MAISIFMFSKESSPPKTAMFSLLYNPRISLERTWWQGKYLCICMDWLLPVTPPPHGRHWATSVSVVSGSPVLQMADSWVDQFYGGKAMHLHSGLEFFWLVQAGFGFAGYVVRQNGGRPVCEKLRGTERTITVINMIRNSMQLKLELAGVCRLVIYHYIQI